jgi:GNAT superfamily N-acetyltransferase
VRVVDLPRERESTYFNCLEDWSEEMREAGSHKEQWYNGMKDRGLGVKVALDDKGSMCGMIHYAPIEHCFADGDNLYFIYCVWVHGYPQGIGNHQKKGIGRELLRAAEEDAAARGGKGMVAWGMSLPVFMRAAWFRKQGYRRVDRIGMQELLWKPFTQDAVAPKWIRPKKKVEGIPGKVVVTSFVHGWCPGQNLVHERARRAAAEFPEGVVFREIDTFDRRIYEEWGIADALFIDARQIRTGPPPSYQVIRAGILKGLKRIRAT